jgi:hypothetical protein
MYKRRDPPPWLPKDLLPPGAQVATAEVTAPTEPACEPDLVPMEGPPEGPSSRSVVPRKPPSPFEAGAGELWGPGWPGVWGATELRVALEPGKGQDAPAGRSIRRPFASPLRPAEVPLASTSRPARTQRSTRAGADGRETWQNSKRERGAPVRGRPLLTLTFRERSRAAARVARAIGRWLGRLPSDDFSGGLTRLAASRGRRGSTGELDDLVLGEARGIAENFGDIRRLEIRIGSEDLVTTLTHS